MNHSFTSAKHKVLLCVFVLITFVTVLVAQKTLPSKEAIPAESGQIMPRPAYNAEELHQNVEAFIKKEDTHDKSTFLDDQHIPNACDKSKCKTFLISFGGASNTVLIPDQVIFFNKETGLAYGGFDSRDFVKGVQTQFQLPIGEYIMVAKHHMYDDIVWNDTPELKVTEDNLDKVDYLGGGMALKDDSSIKPIFLPFYDPRGMHLWGRVQDVQTGLPLAGVKVSVSKFYPNYEGDTDVTAVTDEFGYFFSEKVVDFATSESNLTTIDGESGSYSDVRVYLKYELPGYEDAPQQKDYEYYSFNLGNDEPAITGYGLLKRQGASPSILNSRTEIKKLRKVNNQTKFFKIYQKLISCTMPATIRVGTSCTSCSGGCTQYQYNGSASLNFDAYVKAVLVKEWFSEIWGNYSGAMQALYAGAVAVRTVGAYWINKNPQLSTSYNIGANTCWQVFTPSYFVNIMSNPNYYPKAASAVNATSGWALRNGSVFPKSEFAAETNDNLSQGNCNSNYNGISCGDGHFRKADQISSTCYPSYGVDYVSLGFSDCQNSHPRGMSQRGTFRWATGRYISNVNVIGSNFILPNTLNCIAYCTKSWTQILGHYYPYYTLENCASGETITLSNVSQLCSGLQPNLTDNGSTRSVSGRTLNITAKIKNDGTANAGPASPQTRFVLSYDTYLGNDLPLVNLNYNNFTFLPCGTHSYSFTWTIPNSIPSGTYWLIETLDYYNVIPNESNESNSWYFVGSFYVPPAFSGDDLEYRSDVIATIDIPTTQIEYGTQVEDINSVIPVQTRVQGPTIETDCNAIVSGFKISIPQVGVNSSYFVANSLGQVVCSGKTKNSIISCSVNSEGIYFLSIVDEMGNKCVQKIFVK